MLGILTIENYTWRLLIDLYKNKLYRIICGINLTRDQWYESNYLQSYYNLCGHLGVAVSLKGFIFIEYDFLFKVSV